MADKCDLCHQTSNKLHEAPGSKQLICDSCMEELLGMNDKKEMVDHPAHYGGKNNPYEAIKVIEALGWGPDFCLGNCLKYLMRAGKKDNELEDLRKARWYLDRRIQQLESLEPRTPAHSP